MYANNAPVATEKFLKIASARGDRVKVDHEKGFARTSRGVAPPLILAAVVRSQEPKNGRG